MTRLILVRHGQTGWNPEGRERFRGRADIPLDGVGMRQAEALARRAGEWKAAALYSSPLRRSLMTAEPVAQALGLPVTPHPGLIDIDYGQWQGLSLEEARARDPRLYALWREKPQEVRFPGGEGLEEVHQRALPASLEIARQHEGGTAILVSHLVVCRVLLGAFLGLDLSHFWQVAQDVAAVNYLEVEGAQMRVTLINDTCHLRNLLTP